MLRPCRKPLIVFTPKSLLRHPLATSSLDQLAQGTFLQVIDEQEINSDQVRRVVLCAGKIYFELLQERSKRKQADVAIVRLEQLYPCPLEEIRRTLQRFGSAREIVWCQEFSVQSLLFCLMISNCPTLVGRIHQRLLEATIGNMLSSRKNSLMRP